MTGIERLREFVAGISPFTMVCGVTSMAYDREHTEVSSARLRGFLADIADQIEREQGGRVSSMRVLAVVTDMERHCLGHEGMEDSPVARWARELREALGGNGRDPAADISMSAYDLLPQEDREAITWVREHGGLDAVKRRWECLSYYADPVPRVCMERRLARRQRQIDESHAALRRRNKRIEELNHRASDLTRENAELRKRAMPKGFEWPTYESGEPVMLGDSVTEYVAGGELKVRSVEFRDGVTYLREGFRTEGIVIVRPGERVKRPAVLAADGEPLEVGQTVYATHYGYVKCTVLATEWVVDGYLVEVENEGGCKFRQTPDEFTHQRPVLDADGVPIKVGDTVWRTSDAREFEVTGIDGAFMIRVKDESMEIGVWTTPVGFTHTKPEPPDSAERIADEIDRLREEVALHLGDYLYDEDGNDSIQFSMELVAKRCRALAERERGE